MCSQNVLLAVGVFAALGLSFVKAQTSVCPQLVLGFNMSASDNVTNVGSIITITCHPGFVLDSGETSQDLLCLGTGSWNNSLDFCKRISCSNITSHPNLVIVNSSTPEVTTSYPGDEAIIVTCEEGTVTSDGNTSLVALSCVLNESMVSWNDTIPACEPIECRTLPEMAHAFLEFTTLTYNSNMSVVCMSGRRRPGVQPFRITMTCNSTGNWTISGSAAANIDCNVRQDGYAGCKSPGDLDTGQLLMLADTSLIEDCRTACRNNNYTFSGIRDTDCFCGDLESFGSSIDNSECNTTCSWNDDLFCGGSENKTSVFANLEGCYTIDDLGVLASSVSLLVYSPVTCLEYCRGRDYKVSLLTRSNKCQCINSTSDVVVTPVLPAFCKDSLKDLEDQGLTPDFETTVLATSIEITARSGNSCPDLYSKGVHLHGSYYTSKATVEWCQFKDGTPCDQNWIGFEGSCYWFGFSSVNFDGSYDQCLSQNSHLVSIHSTAENEFIYEALNQIDGMIKDSMWYLGLYDSHGSASFQWNDGSLLTFTDFRGSQPSHPMEARCIGIREYKKNLYWHDEFCEDEGHYICERTSAQYSGCIETIDNLDSAPIEANLTLSVCAQKCLTNGTMYSGVGGNNCYCFDELAAYLSLNWTSCGHPCPGHHYQPCGYNSSVLFVTGGPNVSSLAQDCADLALQGLRNDVFVTKLGEIACVDRNNRTCPFSWLNIDGHCYKFMVGATTKPAMTCSKLGAYVVSLDDENELNQLRTISSSLDTLKIHRWWMIGLFLPRQSGLHRWSSGQFFNQSTFSHTNNSKKNCNVYDRESDESKLVPTKCNYEPFICEIGDEYVGCFETPSTDPVLFDYQEMTILQCVELCRGQGYSVAFLDVQSCWCNSSVAREVQKDHLFCDSFCIDGLAQICGGENHVSAYNVDAFPSFATSCMDLLRQGLFVAGTYVVNGDAVFCTSGDNTTCPQGENNSWIGVGTNGYCLMFGFEKLGNTNALSECRSRGGILASVSSDEEWEFLKQVVTNSKTLHAEIRLRVGARDEFGNKFYSWSNGDFVRDEWDGLVAKNTFVTHNFVKLKPDKLDLKLSADALKMFICSTETEYIGCYNKENNLTPVVDNYNSMTLTMCRHLCLGQQRTIALVHVHACFCVDVLNNLVEVTSDPDCLVSCQGHIGQNCAAGSKLRAYNISNPATSYLAYNCSDLYSRGLLYQGDYLLQDTPEPVPGRCGFDVHQLECPSGWIGYNKSCMLVIPFTVSLQEASDYCVENGGYLFTPKQGQTLSYITNLISEVPVWSEFETWWTGGREVAKSGHVVTADGMYVMADNLEPVPNVNGDCVVLDVQLGSLRRFDCSESLPFICERVPSVFLGCRNTTSTPSVSVDLTDTTTVSQCMELCRANDQPVFSLYQATCNCFQSLPETNNTGSCMEACAGQPEQLCGSNGTYASFYAIDGYQDTMLKSCKSLEMYGVTLKGWYDIIPDLVPVRVLCFDYGDKYMPLLVEGHGSLTASSENEGYPAEGGRLDHLIGSPRSWQPSGDDQTPWLCIILDGVYLIKAIIIQGGRSQTEGKFVKTFRLTWSLNDEPWEYSFLSEFVGNSDTTTVTETFFDEPLVCDKLTILPVGYEVGVALRIELLGELFISFNHTDRYVGCFLDVQEAAFEFPTNVTTFTQCIQYCNSYAYSFIALGEESDGRTTCTCGWRIGVYGRVLDDQCSNTFDTAGYRSGDVASHFYAVYRLYNKSCAANVAPLNSTMTVMKKFEVEGVYTYRTQITYTCIVGYEFPDYNDNKTVTCKEDNEWNETLPDCNVKHCPTPVDIQHGTKVGSDTAYASVVTYICNEGYLNSTNGSIQVVACADTKTWTPEPEDCRPQPCPPPPDVGNAYIVGNVSTFGYQEDIVFQCNDFSQFSDGNTTQTTACDLDGVWSEFGLPDPVKCTYFQCSEVRYVPGAVAVYLNQFEVEFKCKPGHEFKDGSSEVITRCQSDNTWSPITTECKISDSAAIIQSGVCQTHQGQRIQGEMVQTSSRTRFECGIQCLHNPACRYFNYNDVMAWGENCQLYVDTATNSLSATFVPEAGWAAYIMNNDC